MLNLGLYLITDPGLCEGLGLVETVAAAVRGGVTMVQLRDKGASPQSLVERGRALKPLLAAQGVPLIINDDVEAALAIGADGVHLGQSDGTPAAARARLGRQALIGLSVRQIAQARAVDRSQVDYVGIGPVFASTTKSGHAEPLGFEGLAAVRAACPVPAVAIGGLKAEHASAVALTGVQGMAIVSAICGAADPEQAARAVRDAIQAARWLS